MQTTKPVVILTPLWIVVGLSVGPAVALGLSRFAYALLLPPCALISGGVLPTPVP
jgi:hypothetical protein